MGKNNAKKAFGAVLAMKFLSLVINCFWAQTTYQSTDCQNFLKMFKQWSTKMDINSYCGPLIPLFWTPGNIWPSFKAKVDPLIACFTCVQWIPQIHLWCYTCRPLCSQHGGWAWQTLLYRFTNPSPILWLVTSGSNHWWPVETLFTRESPQYWHLVAWILKYVRFARERYTSYYY